MITAQFCGTSCLQSAGFDSYPLIETVKSTFTTGWRRTKHFLNHHMDLVSSIGTLAITTCLLAAKIFPKMPDVIPKSARMVLNVGGIIWLNDQTKNVWKSGRDFTRAIHDKELLPFVETAIKVFVQGVNVLLTCAYFGASILACCGLGPVSTGIYLALRPLSLVSFVMGVASDVWDYYKNETIIKELKHLEEQEAAGRTIAKVMRSYLSIISTHQTSYQPAKDAHLKERQLASSLVRQFDRRTLQIFNDSLGKKTVDNPRIEAIRLFFIAKDSLDIKQAATRSRLTLTVLGYAAMGICRAYPDSLVEMISRWTISVLYNDGFMCYKLDELDLDKALSNEAI